jgi:hypothetical protein
MHGLETLIRLNREAFVVDDNPLNHLVRDADGNAVPAHPLRNHPRIRYLHALLSDMAVDSFYKSRLYRSLYLYADQIVARPVYRNGEGWSDFEALQQVTLGDMNERSLQTSMLRWRCR